MVSQEYVWWNRSNGMDHVWTLAHDFAGCLAWLDNWDHVYYKEMRHSIFISHLGDLAMGCFSPTKDIVIPTMSTNNYVYRWGYDTIVLPLVHIQYYNTLMVMILYVIVWVVLIPP